MPLPDPADLAWMHDDRRRREQRLWVKEHRNRIEELIAKLHEARKLALGMYDADDPVPELIELAIWAAEEELDS